MHRTGAASSLRQTARSCSLCSNTLNDSGCGLCEFKLRCNKSLQLGHLQRAGRGGYGGTVRLASHSRIRRPILSLICSTCAERCERCRRILSHFLSRHFSSVWRQYDFVFTAPDRVGAYPVSSRGGIVNI